MIGGTETDTPSSFQAALAGIDLREIVATLWRERWILISIVGAVMTLAIIVLIQLTPLYTASAVVMVDARRNQIIDIQNVVSDVTADALAVESEIQVLRAPELAERVVQKLDLTKVPEFQPDSGRGWSRLFGGESATPAGMDDPEYRGAVIDLFEDRLSVTTVGRSRAISISFTSDHPGLAAHVANTLAEAYLEQQLEQKYLATRQATDWLNERTADLRRAAEEADLKVEAYRMEHGTVRGRNAERLSDEVQEVSRLVARAKADAETARARLAVAEQVAERGTAAVFGAIGTEFLVRARTSGGAITADSILAALRNESTIADASVAGLETELDLLQADQDRLSRAMVGQRSLEREAAATRGVFETFIDRFKQTQQVTYERPDAWIVSRALVPIERSFPNSMVLLSVAFVGSIIIALGVVFGRERLRAGFVSAAEIERMLGVRPIAVVPRIRAVAFKDRPQDYVVEKPFSAYAEACRALHTSLLLREDRRTAGQGEGGGDAARALVLLVTSSQPGEGKSVLATSLCRVIAKAGRRVLLIDADLRRPSVHTLLNLSLDPGLNAILAGAPLSELRHATDGATGMHVVTAGQAKGDPQEMLRRPVLAEFIASVRDKYDLIVIDSPPVNVVADAQILGTDVDYCLFLAAWSKTPRAGAVAGYRRLAEGGVPMGGIVLSMAEPDAGIGTYGGAGSYYGDSAYIQN
ncbi:GumC family protein [Zavarzinia sp. CC-PAN008]|uniref:GumC family protein n=1 Tax=Zavarzinia sp. CC-PAN008 TaxID=3243332 RepID=UPI003F7424ED